MGKRGPKPNHYPGCTAPAQAPRAGHAEGCPYRKARSGKSKSASAGNERMRLTPEEAARIRAERAKVAGAPFAVDAWPNPDEREEQIHNG